MTPAPRGVADSARTILSIRGLSKTFLGQRALDDVSFDLAAGEVHALIGQNGSGKSTLIKCLAGYYAPDHGASFVLNGQQLALPYSPAQATGLGMVFVHQDLGLIKNLSVAENFAISRGFDARPLSPIKWKAIRARAARELESLGHAIPPHEIVGRLSVAEQTIVAIARAIAGAGEGASVLVLDEPTAALPDARRHPARGERNEVERLFEAVRRVVARGVGVIYVSHKLGEVLDLADRATILRDGRIVETVSIPGLTERDLVRSIVGHDVERVDREPLPAGQAGAELLRVSGLAGRRLRDVSFTLRPGEIVGIAGMLGSGRSELARMLFGAQAPTAGEIHLRGAKVHWTSPAQAVRDGVALVPEDRRRQGGFLRMSVGENLTLPSIRRFWHHGRIVAGAQRARARDLIAEYDIRPPSTSRQFGVLSGGNQQKVVIAKWLTCDPGLVVFDEPVQGVDIGAKAEIYSVMVTAAARGAGVVVISSELDQILGLLDRVLVLRDGRLIADRPAKGMTRQALTRLVYFGTDDDGPDDVQDVASGSGGVPAMTSDSGFHGGLTS